MSEKETEAMDEERLALEEKAMQSERNALKARKAIKYTILSVLVALIFGSGFLWYVFYGPRWGVMQYGVCKVFAEQYVDFPSTIKIREVDYWRRNVRIYLSHSDAAGQFKYDMVECYFGNQNMEITRVRINRNPFSDIDVEAPYNPDILIRFNRGVDAILMNPPSLLLPRSKRNASLDELWQGGD